MRSLRWRLLVTIGGSLLVLWTLVAAWMLTDVRVQLRAALDERLAASARMVAGLVSQLPAQGSPAPDGIAPLLDVVGRDGLACEVSLLRGEVAVQTVARTAGSPSLQDAPAGYSTREFGGKRWRMYVLDWGGVRVATADRLDMREGLVRQAALAAALPFGVALAGTLVILWFAVGAGLVPLENVRSVLERRRPDDDAPLPAMPVPRELEPLVGTVGHLLQRVRDAIARERRFTDDAAHELRTPLTAIKTHLQVLRLACGSSPLPQTADAALTHAGQGVARMQHTLDQLLLLARLDAGAEPAEAERCNAFEAAQHAVRDAEAARNVHGQVVIEAADRSREVAVAEPLLVSALRNLLDNALQPAPDARIILRIEPAAPELVAVTVLDAGPGMSVDECSRAVERFWRRGRSGQGSGLGLSIVNTIAHRHGGSFLLRPRPEGGLEARIVLPAPGSLPHLSAPRCES
jgi:two-component system sensor histidine kinase QseC